MSEYQYYEFRAVDRPLTEEEQQAVGKLSSRVDLSPSHAIFVYNYSDLPTSAEDLLARYFDEMFYIANWGSCHLMFRFPQKAIDLEQVQPHLQSPFVVEEFVSLTEQGQYLVLNMEWHEEAPDWGWIEGAGWLSRLMSLRDEILRADYRLLYLAWLKAMTLEPELLDTVEEPPVPPGLPNYHRGCAPLSNCLNSTNIRSRRRQKSAAARKKSAKGNCARRSVGFRHRFGRSGCCG